MAKASIGDTVRVHYMGKLEDGTVFDTTVARDPIEFTIGQGQVIAGFEQAVIGMEPGQSQTVHIPASKAFGPYQEGLVQMVHPDQLPEGVRPEVGQQLEIPKDNGQSFVVRVADVSESAVTLDANHPLAGKDLIYSIRLVEIL
jgi:FKBP-type peptidyl-prolyl cis-trans isomerase 2